MPVIGKKRDKKIHFEKISFTEKKSIFPSFLKLSTLSVFHQTY